MEETRQTRLRAIGYAIIGFGMYALVDSLNKWLTGGYSIIETLFFNALFAMIPTVALIGGRAGWGVLRVHNRWSVFLRAAAGLGTAVSSLFGFVRMPLADVYAFIFTAPLVIAAFVAVIGRENVGIHRWGAVIVGFLGILVMLRPDPSGFNIGVLGAIGCTVCYCTTSLVVRYMGQRENGYSFAFYGNLFSIILMGALLPFVYVPPTLQDWVLFATTGTVAGLALPILCDAFIRAPSPVVAPFQYTQMLWGMLFGWLLFGDLPTPRLLVGGAIVIVSGLYLFYREAKAEPAPVAGTAERLGA